MCVCVCGCVCVCAANICLYMDTWLRKWSFRAETKRLQQNRLVRAPRLPSGGLVNTTWHTLLHTIQYDYGNSQSLIGKSCINGPCSIVWLILISKGFKERHILQMFVHFLNRHVEAWWSHLRISNICLDWFELLLGSRPHFQQSHIIMLSTRWNIVLAWHQWYQHCRRIILPMIYPTPIPDNVGKTTMNHPFRND